MLSLSLSCPGSSAIFPSGYEAHSPQMSDTCWGSALLYAVSLAQEITRRKDGVVMYTLCGSDDLQAIYFL